MAAKWILLTFATLQCLVTEQIGVNAVSITLREGPGNIETKNGVNELELEIGDSVSLQCIVPGRGQPTGVWVGKGNGISSNANLLQADTGKYSMEVVDRGNAAFYILTIQSVTQEDDGEYRCQSGSDFDTIHLIVQNAIAEPSGGDQDGNQGGEQGGDQSAGQNQGQDAGAGGEGAGEGAEQGTGEGTTQGETQGAGGQKAGQNSGEGVDQSAGLSDGTKKGSVDTGLRITSAVPVSSTSIRVQWVGDKNVAAVVEGYEYQLTIYDIAEDTSETITSIPSASNVVTVNHLRPGTQYQVAVQSFIGGAYGPQSDYVTVTTQDEAEENKSVSIKPRRYNISDIGSPCLFRGWVDVQGQGAANDYCRVVSEGGPQFLSCALAGALDDHVYTSPNASVNWFDAGHMDTWYMKDQDGDGRDDYCRCVGTPPNTVVSCMKAGDTGFLSHDDFQVQASAGCHYNKVNPFLGVP